MRRPCGGFFALNSQQRRENDAGRKTGKSILNGIAIGKLKIYKKKDTVISTAQVADTAAEEARFEEARAKAIDQQTRPV